MNSCIVIPHNGLGDHINMVSMCKYLSNIYDTHISKFSWTCIISH